MPSWLIVGAIFTVALAMRLAHLWQIRDTPFFSVLMGDAKAYDTWAQQLAAGDWVGRDVFYQAPLYPYFLGLVYTLAGHDLLVVRIVQAAVGAVSCVLIGLTAQRLFSTRAGLVAGLGLALYAPAIFFDGLIQKSVLDVFFVCLSLWCVSALIERAAQSHSVPPPTGAWLALGFAMGGLSLTRENALALVAIVAGWAVISSRGPLDAQGFNDSRGLRSMWNERLRPLVTFGLAVALVLLPVALRNYVVGGGFYLTTAQFGPNFYIGNNAGADGTYASLRFGRGAPEYERQDATEIAQRETGRTLSPSEVSRYWTDKALVFVTNQPGRWLALTGRKILLLWNRAEMLDTESQESYADESWPLRSTGWFTHFGVLVPLAVFGGMVLWPQRRRVWVLYALVLTYAASVVMFYVFARYRFPLVPLLVLLAAAGVSAAPQWLRARSAAERAAVAGVVAAVVVFTNWPVLSSTRMRAITETNLATALQADNRMEEAIARYRRAIELQPDHAPAYNNLGTALRAQGKLDEAVDTYERALSINGSYPDAHYNLANALLEKHEPDKAAAHFQVALASIPDSVETRNNLGIALMNQRQYDEAIAAFRGALAIEPTSTKTLRNLATALDARGHVDEAVETLNEVLRIAPQDEAALYDLGSTMLEVGQHEAAIDAFRRALAVNPRSVEAHNNLGIALGSLGRVREAIAEFEQALAIQPNFGDAQRNLEMAKGMVERRSADR